MSWILLIRYPVMIDLFKVFTDLFHVKMFSFYILIFSFAGLSYRVVARLLIWTPFSMITNLILKNTFCIPRPDEVLHAVPVHGYGFPSGHTYITATFFMILFWSDSRRWVRVLCVVTIFMVAFSRLYLGVHSLADVVCGGLMGALIARLAFVNWSSFISFANCYVQIWFVQILSLIFIITLIHTSSAYYLVLPTSLWAGYHLGKMAIGITYSDFSCLRFSGFYLGSIIAIVFAFEPWSVLIVRDHILYILLSFSAYIWSCQRDLRLS